MKGLVCAGGEATRLGELTRVSNKHLLPVGRWPMIYYPLQLLQLAGVREVLVVTGKGHAGQMIDLLGDGRVKARGTGRAAARRSISPTRCRPSPAGSPRSSAWPATSRPASSSWSARRQHLRVRADRRDPQPGTTGAQIFVKEVPDPENFGVVVYGDDGRVTDIVEKAGVVDMRYAEPPSRRTRWSGSTATRPTCSTSSPRSEPSLARRAGDHRRQPHLRAAGRLSVHEVEGWWEDAGKHWQHLAEIGRRIDETGVNK